MTPVCCRHINLFEELELLKEFEKRESTYTTRYTSKKKERKDLETKVHMYVQYMYVCILHKMPLDKFKQCTYVIYLITGMYVRTYVC